jgi:6-pyruvoyltetrahydropterin/6-carboxytetrahydropterin synthase
MLLPIPPVCEGDLMFRVTREIRFCYGHRLLNYDGKCRHLHGHNGRAVITLEAPRLDDLGMVVDFSQIKRVVSTWINEALDHKMILHKDDPLLGYLRQQGEPVFVIDANPTAENIARVIYEHTAAEGFPVVEVRLWETDDSCATYRRDEPHR